MAVRLFQNLSIVRKCSCRKEKVCKRSVGKRKPKNVYAGGVVENHIPKVNETGRSILKQKEQTVALMPGEAGGTAETGYIYLSSASSPSFFITHAAVYNFQNTTTRATWLLCFSKLQRFSRHVCARRPLLKSKLRKLHHRGDAVRLGSRCVLQKTTTHLSTCASLAVLSRLAGV
jgi:hypothetical protein